MQDFIGALDQGTTSTRFIVFDGDGREVVKQQLEHRQILPNPGWVEHDPVEIAARGGGGGEGGPGRSRRAARRWLGSAHSPPPV